MGSEPSGSVFMFRVVVLQLLYDFSDRDIEVEFTWNMLFKCFLS
jgi:hypothetical protein